MVTTSCSPPTRIEPILLEWIYRAFALFDLPLSFVADTVLLPVNLVLWLTPDEAEPMTEMAG